MEFLVINCFRDYCKIFTAKAPGSVDHSTEILLTMLDKVKMIIAPGGTWTHSLWLRRPTPYPLGHRSLVTWGENFVVHLSQCPRYGKSFSFFFLNQANYESKRKVVFLYSFKIFKKHVGIDYIIKCIFFDRLVFPWFP